VDHRHHRRIKGEGDPMNWLTKHPILLGCGILLGAATVVAFWPVFLTATILTAAGYGLYRWTLRYDHRYQLARIHREGLAARAAYEHHLLMAGHPAGIYGRYMPYC
jgi:Flp pilus assembly protein TadB